MTTKGKEAEEAGNQERWLLTYADLITLLLVFFIVMYSMSSADVKKFAELSTSMQQAFGMSVLEGGSSGPPTRGGSILPGEGLAPAAQLAQDLALIQEEMESLGPQLGGAGEISVRQSREGIVISVSGNILFDSGKASLRSGAEMFLNRLAQRLASMSNEVRIEGHTDDIPISTSRYPSNWELSTARALAVVHYLSQVGIAPKRLAAVGYGEHRPVADNTTRQGRRRNRRVDIIIVYPRAEGSGLDVGKGQGSP